MTEILLDWLNNDVKLSKHITNIPDDFSNGFLFGEILHRFNQIKNFHEYKNSNDIDDCLHTFGLLESALRDLEIPLDDARIQEIIHKKKGVSAIILYKIKNKLSRKNINFDTLMTTKENKLHHINRSARFPTQNERYIIDATYRKSDNTENVIKSSILPQHRQKLKLTPFKRASKEKIKEIHDKEEQIQIHSQQVNDVEIDLLEKNLSRLGLDLSTIDPKLKKQNKIMSSEMIMNKMKEKMERTEAVEQNILLFSHEKRLKYEALRVLNNKIKLQEESKIKNERVITENNEIQKEQEYPRRSMFQPEIFFEMLDKEDLQLRKKEMIKKTARKECDYALMSTIMNLILAITDESYNYQRENATELIEVKEWKKWMEMFISNISVKNEIIYFENETGKNASSISQEETSMQMLIDPLSENAECVTATSYEDDELLDYLNFLGNWKKNIIPVSVQDTQLQFADVLGSEYVIAVNGHKVTPFARASKNNIQDIYEPNEDDTENITIPKTNPKNPTLSEILEIVIDLKFPQESSTRHNMSIFYYLPLKFSIIGHKFAGKKTQARVISEQYPGLKVYNIEELLKKSIEIFERLETPIEANPKFKTLKKSQIDQLISEKAAEEEKFKDIRKIIQSYAVSVIKNKQDKDQDQEPPQPDDEMLVDLLLFFLKIDFPEKPYMTYVEEIQQRNKRKREITEELAKIKEDQVKKTKGKPKEEQQLVNELSKLTSDIYKGFILVDFPRNHEQARLLEYKLTGYIPEIEFPYTQNSFTKDKFCQIVDKTLKTAQAQMSYPNSGLDSIVNIDIPSTECTRRLVGRRIDPHNGNIYHLEDNPPPENDKKLFERLQMIPEPAEDKLRKENIEYDFSIHKMIDFYDRMGNAKYNHKYFVNLNGMKPKNSLFNEIQSMVVQKLIQIKEEKEIEICSTEKVMSNIELISQVVALPEEDDFSRYSRKLTEYRKKIPPGTIENIYKGWATLNEIYSSECKMALKTIKKQRDSIATNINRVQSKFIEFLSKPSKKKNVISVYVNKYNSFADKYPELKEHQKVKAEFHNDVTELTDRIWEIIDALKNEAIEERKMIMYSGWIENEMQKFYQILEKLFLLETDKFLTSMAVLREFYHVIDSKAYMFLSEPNAFTVALKPNDILSDVLNFNLEEYDSAGQSKLSFPRIERLYKNCFKLIFKHDEEIRQIENSIKSGYVHNSSTDSSQLRKRKGNFQYSLKTINESLMLDDKKEIVLYDEELKTSMKNEKTKYKYRVTLLKFWGIKSLSEMRNLATFLYNSLDNWIISSVKAQNEAMNALTDHFRTYIEREYKVRYDHDLDVFDIYQVTDANSLLEPKSGTEMVNGKYHFNFQSFLQLYQEIKSHEVYKNYVKVHTFFEIYVKKYLIELASNAIPQSIQKLSFHNFTKFAKYFLLKFPKGRKPLIRYDDRKEFTMIEYINSRHLATILAVIHCKVLYEINESAIKSQGKELLRNSTLIEKEHFMSIKFWFENDNIFTDSVLSLNDGNQDATGLKDLIFEINKNDNNEVNLCELFDVLSLRIIPTLEKSILSKTTYYDLLLI